MYHVLIVAKCIVNCQGSFAPLFFNPVLIVAKCIVNYDVPLRKIIQIVVLIVAKCIVNSVQIVYLYSFLSCINSSKVYCK